MPTSFQQTQQLTCPYCGQPFDASIWLIVDAAERPDLLEKIQVGTLHQVFCPHCQFQVEVDAPLLLYFSDSPLPLGAPFGDDKGPGVRVLFSPAQRTTAEQGQEQARALLECLRQSLGDAWQDDWLSRELPAVPRPLLPLALREELEAAQRKMQEESAGSRVAAELGALLEEIVRLHHPSEMPRKVELCKRALGMVEREDNPVLWAELQVELANALQQNPLDNRAENLEKAIHHYQQALGVRTRQAYPEQWAMTQHNLGEAYRNRIRGERAKNLERAIFHFQQALEVLTRKVYPEQWATTQNNLGNAYLERIRGERAENLEQAIFHYRQALEVRTRQAYPEQWAATQHNLGAAYLERIRGERAKNLERAIFHFQQALEVRTRQAYPEDWARTQNNLAIAYRNRIRGERAENLEQAVSTTGRRWKCIPARPTRSNGRPPKTTWQLPMMSAFGGSGRRIWSRRFSTTSRRWKY